MCSIVAHIVATSNCSPPRSTSVTSPVSTRCPNSLRAYSAANGENSTPVTS